MKLYLRLKKANKVLLTDSQHLCVSFKPLIKDDLAYLFNPNFSCKELSQVMLIVKYLFGTLKDSRHLHTS